MGFLDFLSGGSDERARKRHAARVANKRAQAPDRWDSIKALGEMKSSAAVEALLVRFTFKVDPSITDQEEKDATYQAILGAGDAAVPPIVAFLRTADSVAWPMKLLQRLVPDEKIVELLVDTLSDMDTEYERDPQKKIQVLAELAERKDPRIRPAVERFLEDINETARFHAVSAVFTQEDAEASRAPITRVLVEDESNRIRARILDGFIAQGWTLDESAQGVKSKLPTGYAVNEAG
ncbi:MAG: HEAT repeat domain-containing protein, partial [Polyangiaceae bacterium]|nr:HEAT repeat domain-containing protein [Polyangiaceae bacterium]